NELGPVPRKQSNLSTTSNGCPFGCRQCNRVTRWCHFDTPIVRVQGLDRRARTCAVDPSAFKFRITLALFGSLFALGLHPIVPCVLSPIALCSLSLWTNTIQKYYWGFALWYYRYFSSVLLEFFWGRAYSQ